MIAFLVPFAARIVGQRAARAAVWVALIIALVAILLASKALYDATIIGNHDARQDAKTATAARQSSEDATAALNKVDREFQAGQDQIKEEVDEAADNGGSALDAYFRGVRRTSDHD